MNLNSLFGVILIILGIFWYWYSFRKIDKSLSKYYTIPRDVSTSIIMILIGILLLLGKIEF